MELKEVQSKIICWSSCGANGYVGSFPPRLPQSYIGLCSYVCYVFAISVQIKRLL